MSRLMKILRKGVFYMTHEEFIKWCQEDYTEEERLLDIKEHDEFSCLVCSHRSWLPLLPDWDAPCMTCTLKKEVI
jgi:hypothetical protein